MIYGLGLRHARILAGLAFVLAVSIPLVGCSGATSDPAAEPTEDLVVGDASGAGSQQQTAAETEPTPPATFSPDQLSVCDEMVPELATALGLEPEDLPIEGAPWVDMADGTAYMGCLVSFEGLGEALGVGPNSYMEPAHTLRSVLSAKGWDEDLQFAADGPGASVFGYRGPSEVCTASVSFAAPEGTDCTGQDAVTCGLPPAEQVYTMQLTCASTDEVVEE